jgi:hypothetical protein
MPEAGSGIAKGKTGDFGSLLIVFSPSWQLIG